MNEFEDLEQTHQPEQLDLLLVKDTLQAADRLLKRCAPDLGDRFLADLIDRTPSTVHNQLDGSDPNKTPSFALAVALAMSPLSLADQVGCCVALLFFGCVVFYSLLRAFK